MASRGERSENADPLPQSPTPSTMRTIRLIPVLFLFAACGSSHPLAGGWNQELPGDAKGMYLEFDTGSDKCLLHTAPTGADGAHDDVNGTYAWDAASRTVTVHCKLAGAGKADTWTGVLDGEHLELSSADGKLKFHHGGEGHHH